MLICVPSTDIIDMYRYTGISAYAMLLHQGYQVRFCQITYKKNTVVFIRPIRFNSRSLGTQSILVMF